MHSSRPSAQKPALVSVRDGSDQVGYVVERILESREAGVPLKAQAVLFRAAHHSAELEIELSRRNIPFVKFGGLRFLEAAHVKDVLSVLRLAENPGDRVAGFRVLQLMPGIGPTTAGRLLERIAEPLEPCEVIREFRPPAATQEDWPAFVELFVRLRSSQASWPGDLGAVRAWYEPHLERLHADAQIRRADLHQLEQIAAGFPTRERFLTELTLDPPNATSDQADAPLLDEDYLILSTIHSAKGQEWKSVYVLNVVDGCIPSDMATDTPAQIEEERRLLYVAMTRAKDDLHLIIPHPLHPGRHSRPLHLFSLAPCTPSGPLDDALSHHRADRSENPHARHVGLMMPDLKWHCNGTTTKGPGLRDRGPLRLHAAPARPSGIADSWPAIMSEESVSETPPPERRWRRPSRSQTRPSGPGAQMLRVRQFSSTSRTIG